MLSCRNERGGLWKADCAAAWSASCHGSDRDYGYGYGFAYQEVLADARTVS